MIKETKTRFVAVEYNDNGTCKKVLQLVNLTESDYKKLLNQSAESRQHGREKSKSIETKIATNTKRIDIMTFLLAKSIYDNYVDRGVFEEDKDFEQAVYDCLFDDKKIILVGPEPFQKILEKVAGGFNE